MSKLVPVAVATLLTVGALTPVFLAHAAEPKPAVGGRSKHIAALRRERAEEGARRLSGEKRRKNGAEDKKD